MRWGEVDLDAAVWIIPAARMKAGKLHRVPLSPPAVALLRRIRPEQPITEALVFDGTKPGRPLSDMSLTCVLRRMNSVSASGPPLWRDPVQNKPIRVHGFRSTFRIWAAECTSYPREIVEAALAHTLRDQVEAAYARTDLLERRRPLMTEWAAFASERR